MIKYFFFKTWWCAHMPSKENTSKWTMKLEIYDPKTFEEKCTKILLVAD